MREVVFFTEVSENTINAYPQNQHFNLVSGLLSDADSNKMGTEDIELVDRNLTLFISMLKEKLKELIINYEYWTTEKSVDGWMEFEGRKYPYDMHNEQEKNVVLYYDIFYLANEADKNQTSFFIGVRPSLNSDERRLIITMKRQAQATSFESLLLSYNQFFPEFSLSKEKFSECLDNVVLYKLAQEKNAGLFEVTLKGRFCL